MALIAGILAPPHALQRAEVEARISSYPLFAGRPLALTLLDLPHGAGFLIAAGIQDAPIQPIVAETPDATLLAMGYFRDRRRHALTHRTLPAHVLSPDQRATLTPDLLTALEGEYVTLLHQGDAPELHLVNDRFAARPAFLLQDHARVLVGTDLAFLTHLHDRTLDADPLGLMSLFALEHTVGAGTHLRGVQKLQPGTHAVVALDRCTLRRYWTLGYDVVDPAPDRAQQTAEALRAGTAWRAQLWGDAPLTVSLSGGLDSRLVAACLPDPTQVTALTIGVAESREVQVAAQVAQSLGMRHELLTLDDVPLSAMLPDLALMTGGLLPLHHPATTLALNQRVARAHHVTFGGGPGDVLAGSYVPDAWFLTADVEPALDLYTRLRLKDLAHLSRFFRPEVFTSVAPQLHALVRESLGQMQGPTAANRITAWAMAVRQPSFTFLGPSAQADDLIELSPHLDYAYADHMLSLPADALFQKNFYKHMLATQFAAMAAIPYANTGAPITGQPATVSAWALPLHGVGLRAQAALPAVVRERAMALYGLADRTFGAKAAYSFFGYLTQDRPLMGALTETLAADPWLAEWIDVPRALAFVAATQRAGLRHEELAARFLGCLVTITQQVR